MHNITPKICIVFNSGAAGDFFASLLHQQIYNQEYQIEIDGTGKVANQISSAFKDACKMFYESKFDKIFLIIKQI